jgi:O-antigen ligase
MLSSFNALSLSIAFVAVLAISPVAPGAGNVLFLCAGGASLLLLWRHLPHCLNRPVVWMTLLGLVLLAIAYGAGSDSIGGLIGLAYFAPLVAIGPLVVGVRGEAGHWGRCIGVLALSGAAGAAIVAVNDVVVTHTLRAGETVANPIHFADVALLVGFCSPIGFVWGRGYSRYLFLLGPLLAMVAVLLSGTRGAVVAIVAMLSAAAIIAVFVGLISSRKMGIGLGVVILIGASTLLLGAGQISGVQRVLSDISEVLRFGLPTDTSTSDRLQMYLGGFRAFLRSPLFGNGPVNFTAVAGRLADVPFEGAPHLHNDLADFAASAGTLGVIAYLLFLTAPLLEVMRAPDSRQKPGMIVVVGTLMVGFFVMGLTNAMFGILTITICFTAICIIVGILIEPSRDDRTKPTTEMRLGNP